MSFSERLRRRKVLWDEGLLWQRQLANKVTAKLFALRAGVPVPKLYWLGDNYRLLPPQNLPDTFVMKPLYGHSGQGVIPVENGVDNRTGRSIEWARIRTVYKSHSRGALIEEYQPGSDGSYKTIEGYKIFAFGPACIIRYNNEHFDTASAKIKCNYEAYCDEHWTPIEQRMSDYAPQGPVPAPSPFTGELLDYARRLSKAYETFVRLDFYVTPDGARFGEFSPFPYNGKHWTEFGDQYLGSLWEKHLGAAP